MKGLYQKRGWWYYQAPKPKGGDRPKPVALKTQNEVEAINWVTDHQWAGMIVAAETKDTLREILPRYYTAKHYDRKSTRRARQTILDAFAERMGNPRITDVTKQLILDWRVLLSESGGTATSGKSLSQTTITSYLITLKAFLSWCVEEKILRKNPAVGLGRQTTVRKTRLKEFHTLEQRERMLAGCKVDEPGLINHLGFFVGLRKMEMLVLNPSWIYISPDKTHGSIRVQPTMIELTDGTHVLWEPKTDRGTRTIPMHKRLIDFLLEYGIKSPFLLAPEKTRFPTDEKQSLRYDPKKALATIAKNAGAGKTNYHKLRHSFATHLAMGGMSMAELAGLLGDTVTVTERTYAGYSPRSSKESLPGL